MKMKIALLTGDSYRHKYYCNEVLHNYDISLLVKVKRSLNIAEETKIDYLNEEDKKLLDDHTSLRIKKEQEYFLPRGKDFYEDNVKQILEVSQNEVNSEKVINAFKSVKVDVALVFGTALIKKRLLNVMPNITINLSGLSPYYKGAATLFWPFYFMEPQYAGHTFHIVDLKIDHGNILHQNRPPIYANDTLPDIGCRDVIEATKELPKLLEKIKDEKIKYYQQKSKGKIFYTKDFKPHHLRVVKFLLERGFLKEYLNNKHLFPDPKIITQLD